MILFVLNPIALRKARIVCNFGLSECNRACLFQLCLDTKPYQAHYLSVFWVLRAHVQFSRFDKADATAEVQ